VEQFATAGYRTVQSKEITWRRRPYVLDHIFYNAPLRCVSHQVAPTPASDHHTLVADFEWVD
jgi:endonuclease/exonuclease/phosphatase (EEP) superfamily protein YafD